MGVVLADVIAWSMVMSTLTIGLVIFVPLFYRRSSIEPIKSRRPNLVLGIALLNYVSILEPFVRRTFGTEHCVTRNLNNFLVGFLYHCYFVRAWLLWHHFETLHEMVLFNQDESSHSESKNAKKYWFLERRHWLEPRFYVKVILSGIPFWFLPPIIIFAVHGNCLHGKIDFLMNSVSSFFYIIELSCFVLIAIKLRKQYDFFWIKSELKIGALCAVALLTIWALVVNVPAADEFNDNVFGLSSICFVLTNVVGIVLSIFVPVLLSYKTKGVKEHSVSGETIKTKELKNLYDVLDDQEACAILEQFMLGEFSVENLLCLRNTKTLTLMIEQQKSSDSQGLAQVHKFFNTFIKVGSELEVNLSFVVRNEFTQAIEEQRVLKDFAPLLENVQKHIVDLIMKDTWRRFVLSPLFEKLEISRNMHTRHTNLLSSYRTDSPSAV